MRRGGAEGRGFAGWRLELVDIWKKSKWRTLLLMGGYAMKYYGMVDSHDTIFGLLHLA
jgi:hypothetical protein